MSCLLIVNSCFELKCNLFCSFSSSVAVKSFKEENILQEVMNSCQDRTDPETSQETEEPSKVKNGAFLPFFLSYIMLFLFSV